MAAAADKYDFVVRWQPFLLRPDTPLEGVQKPPATPGNPRVGARLKESGSSVGIDFTGKSDTLPNTIPCHALMEYAKEQNMKKQDSLAELLFKAYFTDGTPLNADGLVKLAVEVGLDKNEAKKHVKGDEWLTEAYEASKSWKRSGVTGVPCFFMNNQRTFSGAQDVDAFLKVFDVVAEKFPLEATTSTNA